MKAVKKFLSFENLKKCKEMLKDKKIKKYHKLILGELYFLLLENAKDKHKGMMKRYLTTALLELEVMLTAHKQYLVSPNFPDKIKVSKKDCKGIIHWNKAVKGYLCIDCGFYDGNKTIMEE